MSTLSPASASSPAGPSNTQRNPPPTLFQGPNASSISLSAPPTTATTQRASLLHSRSTRGVETPSLNRTRTQGPRAPAGGGAAAAAAAAQKEDNRIDAEWAKMQLTLDEVESSALGSTHVFGNAHDAALEELREAQIELARAWGREEADEDAMTAELEEEDGKEKNKSSKAKGDGKNEGEEEDDSDIAEARRRREANDRFFKKMGEGVEEVVDKLEGVAAAMAKVEKESREIWDERDGEESITS
ncbi:MAG: hypothetical protein Q9163_004478 [Psora crenata]